jgi:hypothetical protein
MPKYSDYREYETWVEELLEANQELRQLGLPTESVPRGYNEEDTRYKAWLKRKGWD